MGYRRPTSIFRPTILGLFFSLGWSWTTAAQPATEDVPTVEIPSAPSESILLLAPDAMRAEWTAALQLELAARGGVAWSADVPSAPTALIGDALAQSAARERGARAAVWLERRPDGLRLRLIEADAEDARVTPVAEDVDPRTMALIVVSLLERTSLDLSVTAVESEPQAAATGEAREPLRDDEEIRQGPPRHRQWLQWSGRVGLGPWLIGNDARVDVGGTIRGGMGVSIDVLELSVFHDAGLHAGATFFGEPSALPIFRTCLDVGVRIPVDRIGVHLGGMGCIGSTLTSHIDAFTFQRVGPDFLPQVGGGGYASVSFAIENWIHLHVRAEMQATWTLLFDNAVDVFPAVTTFLSFS